MHGHILNLPGGRSLRTSSNINIAWDFQTPINNLRIASLLVSQRFAGRGSPRPGRRQGAALLDHVRVQHGNWFVYDPATNVGGDGAFYPNSFLRLAKFTDGTSKTLMAAEVKAWTHYTRNGGPSSTTIPKDTR